MRVLEVYIFKVATVGAYYDKLRLYRASTENGSYSQIAEQDLVTTTGVQTVVDTAGLPTDFYKYTLYKSSAPTAESAQTPLGLWFCSVADLKSRLKETGNSADDIYANCIVSATRQVRNWVGRDFYQKIETRYFEGKGLGRNRSDLPPYKLWIDDCVTLTDIVLDYSGGVSGSSLTTLTLNTHVYLWPQEAPQRTYPYIALVWIPGASLPIISTSLGYSNSYHNLMTFPQGYRAARLTGTWGFPADPITGSPIPADVQEATLEIAARLYRGRDNAYSRVIGNNDLGQQTIADSFFNSDTKQLLSQYKKVKL